MIINDILHILFRRVPPETVIKHWLDEKTHLNLEPISKFYAKENSSLGKLLVNALQNEYDHYTVDEAQYALRYAKEYELFGLGDNGDFGVFGLVAKSVEDMLITDNNNECLCKSKEVLPFRELTHTIDPLIFISAFLAKYDIEQGFTRNVFSWNPIVRSDDPDLQHILNKGIAENHFHIGGSSNAFMFSWLCLTNHFTPERKKEFVIDTEPLDTVYVSSPFGQESNYLLSFKAVCIRYFLFMRLHGKWAVSLSEEEMSEYQIIQDDKSFLNSEKETEALRKVNDKWLKKMLSLTEENCHLEMYSVNEYLNAMRSFCSPTDDSGFIPDYALAFEPIHSEKDESVSSGICAVRNYERRLYRPFAGEQRLQYELFRAVFTKDVELKPYWDVIYAYLLIYCRIRGELIQSNDRIGFGNFLKYQDRKGSFTRSYSEYGDMRDGIAERVVLENPQVVSFEGRFIPTDKSDKLIKKTQRLIDLGTKSICGVSDFCEEVSGCGKLHCKEQELRNKMRFVIHFPKNAQPIRDNESIELIKPRDNKVREKTMKQTNAFLSAREQRPDIMNLVRGVDACSSEIDCRPEVFACAIRKICMHRLEMGSSLEEKIPVMRITYHAGEDFLDPLDGLRAIDEAIMFCNMKSGDRIGHALALGIDCEKWYAQKDYTVLMHSQELLDNLVWLYGAMRRYKIENLSAENEIISVFTNLFSYIYLQDVSNDFLLHTINIEQYRLSLLLRGNDPQLYIFNPGSEHNRFLESWSSAEPWQVLGASTNHSDILPSLLFHCYHFDFAMKKRSERIERYSIPRSIIDVVKAVQEKMRYDIAHKNILIECNPSSNFLIGTFKDYLEHPIFTFNNKNLISYCVKNDDNNLHLNASINTDDLGVFDTSLENEYALLVSALENYNEYMPDEKKIPRDNIFDWVDVIRENGIKQIFK